VPLRYASRNIRIGKNRIKTPFARRRRRILPLSSVEKSFVQHPLDAQGSF
jgi:hypothetical protein